MATKISNSQYIDFDGKKQVSLNNLYVEIFMGESSKLTFVSLANLYVITGSKDGEVQTRRVSSYNDFVKNLANDKIANSASGIQSIRYGLKNAPKVKIKDVDIPSAYDSISIDAKGTTKEQKVSYGLKRNLSVVEATDTDAESDKYYLVKIAGVQKFVKKEDIYYYDNANKKKYLKDFKGRFSFLLGKTFFDGNGDRISEIYLEKLYVFPRVNAREYVDVDKMEKVGYKAVEEIGADGKQTVTYQTVVEKIDRYFSVQEYVKKTVDDEKNPGETKEISLIKIKNFQITAGGQFVALTINNTTEMVRLSNLFDENGTKIKSLGEMVGKSIQVRDDNGNIVGITEPLTYEQANLFYDTIKTYQKTERQLDETTFLRLKTGDYVNEQLSIQPYGFKFAKSGNTRFDSLLVKTQAEDGTVKYIIVPRDYFDKHGNTALLHRDNSRPIVRCDINDKDCVAIQTTSQKMEIEQCSIVKSFRNFEGEISETAKQDAYQQFIDDYKAGNYILDYAVIDGVVEALDNHNRYELTDTIYEEDLAENTLQYRAMRCKDLAFKDGKVAGGPKYDIGKGISSAYSIWGNFLLKSFAVAHLSAIFIPVVGPIALSVYAAGMVAALPAIPALNFVYGAIKNRTKSDFEDKTVYNRKVKAKEYKKELERLYERMTGKDQVPLNEKRFNDEFDKIINQILSLSATTNNNTLSVVGGKVTVDNNSAHQLKRYKAEYNANVVALAKSDRKLAKAKREFDALQLQMETYEAEGKIPDVAFKSKYEAAKEKYFRLSNENATLLEEKARLDKMDRKSPTYPAQAQRDKLLSVARVMKLAVYVKTFPESEYAKEAFSTLGDKEKELLTKIKLDFDNGLFIDKIGISSNEQDLVDRGLDAESKNAWLNLQSALLAIDEKMNAPQQKTNLDEESQPDVAPSPEVDEKDEKLEKERAMAENLERIYSEYGVTKVNKNGTLFWSKANFDLLSDKMGRFVELLEQDDMSAEEKTEFADLKLFIYANRKFINKVIDERESGKTKNLSNEVYDKFFELNTKISNAISKSGGIVKHDGSFVF